MEKEERKYRRRFILFIVLGIVSFLFLYLGNQVRTEKVEQKQEQSFNNWEIQKSDMNGAKLIEDKNIYDHNNQIFDVYISVFPTKDKKGEMINFSSFSKHIPRRHNFNPVLNCNVQILGEGKKIDPLTAIDQKNATIRVRGNSSRGDKYKSYKVKLDKEHVEFMGQTTLNINKHSEDVTKIATKFETDLLSEIKDIMSFRTYFMRVWIRDTSLPKNEQKFKYYGLYTEIEQPNKKYLESRGCSPNAVMYKARNFNFSLREELKNMDDLNYDETEFEKVLGIREADSHEKLLEMLEAVNDETRDFEEIFNKYFEEDNYLTWMAFNLLMGNQDIINHNYILYSPKNSLTWYFIPWDFDGTLRFNEYESSLMKLPISLRGIQKLNQNVLHKRYMRMDGSLEKLKKKMKELLQNVITREKTNQLLNGYLPVLEKTMSLKPDIELLEMPPDELDDYLNVLYDGILENYNIFLDSLEYPTPMYVSFPVKERNNSVRFAWSPSFSYQGRTITYNVQVFSDFNMKHLVWEKKNISTTHCIKKDGLRKGIYYLKVTAVDEKGKEQLSMERFETMLTETKGYNVNGLLEFTID